MDYILLSTSISHSIAECFIHDHHDLNFSDHLPVSVMLRGEYLVGSQATLNSRVNWRKSLEDGLIPAYAQSVFDAILPLLSCGFQSVTELNNEIISISKSITLAASKNLPSFHHRYIKPYIKDSELSSLHKQSRKIWEQWKSAGCPREGTLYEEKRDAKKVRRHVALCCAREDRAKIQAWDILFRKSNHSCFRSPNPRTECKGLRINNNICTDSQVIANHFRSYFKHLATSSQSPSLMEAESIIPDLEISSFLNCEGILDTEIALEEIEDALKTLKLGKSGGIDSLDPETHLL